MGESHSLIGQLEERFTASPTALPGAYNIQLTWESLLEDVTVGQIWGENKGTNFYMFAEWLLTMEHLFLFTINLTWSGMKGLAKISLNWKMLFLSYECTRLTKASLIINYLSALSHLGWVSCFENAAKIFFFLFFLLLLLFSLLPLGLP